MILLLFILVVKSNVNIVKCSASSAVDTTLSDTLKWKYDAVNPNCTSANGGRNPCKDVRICDFAVASLMLGGWPTICGWVGKGVPKVCCGLPLVLGGGLMGKVDAEKSRKRECGRKTMSLRLSETENKFFDIVKTLPPVDISDPDTFDPPLDLSVESMLGPLQKMTSPQADFPWMVAIYKGSTLLCGGALIDRKHVLTAAHCFAFQNLQIDPSLYTVHIGNVEVDGGFFFHVATIKVHEGYIPSRYENDIAILTLSIEILTPVIAHICLPDVEIANMDLTGKDATSLEWEKGGVGRKTAPALRIVDNVPVVSNSECRSIFSQLTNTATRSDISDKFICVGKGKRRKSACQQNSGGLLMYKNNYQKVADFHPSIPWTLLGIAFSDCGESDHPSFYSRVSSYKDWIARNTK